MELSLVPMLVAGESISPEARQALRENRLQDAAEILMRQYDLSCVEAVTSWISQCAVASRMTLTARLDCRIKGT